MIFRDRIAAAIRIHGHPICTGIDPAAARPGTFLHGESVRLGPENYLLSFARALIDASAGTASTVKFQSAYFECCGHTGVRALEQSMRYARDRGLLTILDAKRGDISSTMAAYGSAAFDVMGADAMTVTPYMGWDVIQPLIPWLLKGYGAYVVWLTSNASAREIQAPQLAESSRPVVTHVADVLCQHARQAGVMGALGWVAGATRVEEVAAAVAAFSEPVPLLMPGVGAQGGTIDAGLRNLIGTHYASLIPISRGLTEAGPEAPPPANWLQFSDRVKQRLLAFADQTRGL